MQGMEYPSISTELLNASGGLTDKTSFPQINGKNDHGKYKLNQKLATLEKGDLSL